MQNPNRMMTLILHRPDVDFATQRLVAIVFHDPNRFIELDIENVGLVSGTMQVICHFQPAPVQYDPLSISLVGPLPEIRYHSNPVTTIEEW